MAQYTAPAALSELPEGAVDLDAICIQPENNFQKKLTQARMAQDLRTWRSTDTPLRVHALLGNLATRGSSTFLTAFPADRYAP